MVQNSGKTLHAGSFKPLNQPEPLAVEENSGGKPLDFKFRSRQVVIAIEDTWRLEDEWWRAIPLIRVYYNVTLASGQRHVIFKDLVANCWYRQSY